LNMNLLAVFGCVRWRVEYDFFEYSGNRTI